MRLTGTGNVLIGTTTDAGYKLDVGGNLRIKGGNNDTFYVNNDGSQFTAAYFQNNGTTRGALQLDNTANSFRICAVGSTTVLKLGTVATDYVTIDTAGKFGIGLVPTQILDIASAQSFVNTTSTTGTNRVGYLANNTSGTAYLALESSTGGGWITGTSPYSALYGHSANYPIHFVQGVVRMTLAPGGNLLIGTTADSGFKLDVNGTVRGSVFYGSGMNLTNIPTSGVAGLDTTLALLAPKAAPVFVTSLTVNGVRPFSFDPSAGSARIKASTGGWAVAYGALGSSGTDYEGFGAMGVNDALNYYYIGKYGYEAVKIYPGGNTVIGTGADTGYKLDVNGSFHQGTAVLGIDIYDNAIRFTGSGSGPLIYTAGYTQPLGLDAAFIKLNPVSGGNVLIGTATDNGNTVQVAGKAGTTNAYATLQVRSHGTATYGYAARLLLTNTHGADAEFRMADSGSGVTYNAEPNFLTMSVPAGYGIRLNANAVANAGLRITSAGNTLFGTGTDSGNRLTIAGTAQATSFVSTTDTRYDVADGTAWDLRPKAAQYGFTIRFTPHASLGGVANRSMKFGVFNNSNVYYNILTLDDAYNATFTGTVTGTTFYGSGAGLTTGTIPLASVIGAAPITQPWFDGPVLIQTAGGAMNSTRADMSSYAYGGLVLGSVTGTKSMALAIGGTFRSFSSGGNPTALISFHSFDTNVSLINSLGASIAGHGDSDVTTDLGMHLVFKTRAGVGAVTEKMRIQAGGNVVMSNNLLIGTTTDSGHSMHVYGAGQSVTNITDSGNKGSMLYLQDAGGGVGNGGAVLFGAYYGSFAAIKGSNQNGSPNTTGDIVFLNRRSISDTFLTESMRIGYNGVVSIANNLSSSGTISSTVGMVVNGTVAGSGITDVTNTGTINTGGFRARWSTGYGVSLEAWNSASPQWGIFKWSGSAPAVVMQGNYGTVDVGFAGNVNASGGFTCAGGSVFTGLGTGITGMTVSQISGAAPIASPTFTGTVTASAFSGPLTGLASTATGTQYLAIADGSTGTFQGTQPAPSRSADSLPSAFAHGITSEFKLTANINIPVADTGRGSASTPVPIVRGSYAALLTVAPYTGTAASGGGANYQLGFFNPATNLAIPRLMIRAGIDSTWSAWNEILQTIGTPDVTPTMTFVGDSLSTLMGHLTSPRSIDWYVNLPTYNGQTFAKSNIAVFGKFLVDMVDDAPSNLWPLYHSKGGLNIVSIWAGANDINPSPSGHSAKSSGQIYSDLREFCSGLRLKGFKVVVSSLTSSYFDETKRLALNDMIRRTWPEFADAFADLGANSSIGASGAYSNTTYFIDNLHLTDAGMAIAGGILAIAVQKIFTQYGHVQQLAQRTLFGGTTQESGSAAYYGYNVGYSNGWFNNASSEGSSMLYQYNGDLTVYCRKPGDSAGAGTTVAMLLATGKMGINCSPSFDLDVQGVAVGGHTWPNIHVGATAYMGSTWQNDSYFGANVYNYNGWLNPTGGIGSSMLYMYDGDITFYMRASGDAAGAGSARFQFFKAGNLTATGTITAGGFSGPGTGLTGTASGLTAGNATTCAGFSIDQNFTVTASPSMAGLTLTNSTGLVVARTGYNAGSVFFGTGGTHYLLWDSAFSGGACYSLGGSEGLRINGNYALTTASYTTSGGLNGSASTAARGDHAHYLVGTDTSAQNNIVSGAYAVWTVAVTSAALGDPCCGGHSGISGSSTWEIQQCVVSSAGQVYLKIKNVSGSTQSLTGTAKVIVFK